MTISAGTLLGPYEILSPLGAGGMGEVYRARDKKLDRDVAIKVLPESMAGHPETLARFEREARAVAALSHPNILSIFDFGTHDGRAYAVTELLEGETLRGKLDAGPISQREVVHVALQIAKGLSAAHEKGVVHRDLKPENVFVTRDGRLKILDFGLAKRTGSDDDGETSSPTASKHTEPGTVMGTMGYMSPEQVRGLPVDHRSDIFSFGAILYELLSGKRAFKRDTSSDTIAATLKEEPPELSESGRNIPASLDHIVRHCIEKDRERRFQSARDIAFALGEASGPASATSPAQTVVPAFSKNRALLVVAVIATLALAGVVLLRRSGRRPVGAEGVKRVAVLPFENLGSPEDDYFADGVADEIRGKLTSLQGIEVIARGSSTPYKKTSKTPGQIADELGVKYLLTATVRWQKGTDASRVHVTPELVEVKDSGAPTSRWQQTFDASMTDVFQVQADVASRVAAALGVALGSGDQKRLSTKPTKNLAAYDAYLKGEEASQGLTLIDAPSTKRAIDFYEQAVALDPAFAPAWGELGRALMSLYDGSGATPERAERARFAAERSIELAPERPEGHLARGSYRRWVVRDIPGALQDFATAHHAAPGLAAPFSAMANAEYSLGRWEDGLARLRQGKLLDPRSVSVARSLAIMLHWMRRYPEARKAADDCLALSPRNLSALNYKAMTYLGEGNLAGAQATLHAAEKNVDAVSIVSYMASHWSMIWAFDSAQFDLLLRLPASSFDSEGQWASFLAQAHRLRGDSGRARHLAEFAVKFAEDAVRADPQNVENHAVLGYRYALAGRKDDAIREGELAVERIPPSKDAFAGPYYQFYLVRSYMLLGEPEKALDKLEPLLKIPFILSKEWLKIDPTFDPLRSNPRFQKLVAGQ